MQNLTHVSYQLPFLQWIPRNWDAAIPFFQHLNLIQPNEDMYLISQENTLYHSSDQIKTKKINFNLPAPRNKLSSSEDNN